MLALTEFKIYEQLDSIWFYFECIRVICLETTNFLLHSHSRPNISCFRPFHAPFCVVCFIKLRLFYFNSYCRKLPIVKPTSDAKAEAQPLTQVTTPHQETNRSDPDDSSYESNVSLSQWAI